MKHLPKNQKKENVFISCVDSEGNTIDFYLSQRRNANAAKRFLKKALVSFHATKPRTITAHGSKAYVTNLVNSTVYIVDLTTNMIIPPTITGFSYPPEITIK